MEHENLGIDANGGATSGLNHGGESTDVVLRGGLPGEVHIRICGQLGAKFPGPTRRSVFRCVSTTGPSCQHLCKWANVSTILQTTASSRLYAAFFSGRS